MQRCASFLGGCCYCTVLCAVPGSCNLACRQCALLYWLRCCSSRPEITVRPAGRWPSSCSPGSSSSDGFCQLRRAGWRRRFNQCRHGCPGGRRRGAGKHLPAVWQRYHEQQGWGEQKGLLSFGMKSVLHCLNRLTHGLQGNHQNLCILLLTALQILRPTQHLFGQQTWVLAAMAASGALRTQPKAPRCACGFAACRWAGDCPCKRCI